MDMEDKTSSLPERQVLVPTNISRYGQSNSEDVAQEGYRANEVPEIPQQAIFSSKKRLFRTKNHLGPFDSERVHLEGDVQNADLKAGEAYATQGGMDGLTRPEGRILAPQRSQSLQAIPRVLLQGSKLEIQGNALRSQYCTPNFHKTHILHSTVSGEGRHLVPSLPGRSAHHSGFQRGVLAETQESNRDPTGPGA